MCKLRSTLYVVRCTLYVVRCVKQIMEKHLNLWDLEKIARQYVGFNDLVVKEYHDLFEFGTKYYPDAVCLRPVINNGFSKTLVLQWRTNNFVDALGFKYIYTFRHHLLQCNKHCDTMQTNIVSAPAVLFKDNPYRASVLK